MGYECTGDNLTHSLFGGTETVLSHKKYLISLSDFFDNNRYCFKVLGHEKICSYVPKIPSGSFMSELGEQKIFLVDLNN